MRANILIAKLKSSEKTFNMSLISLLIFNSFGVVRKSSSTCDRIEFFEREKCFLHRLFSLINLIMMIIRFFLLNIFSPDTEHEVQINNRTFMTHNHLKAWTMGLLRPKYIAYIYSSLLSLQISIEFYKIFMKINEKHLNMSLKPLYTLEEENNSDHVERMRKRGNLVELFRNNWSKVKFFYVYYPFIYSICVCSVELSVLIIYYKNSTPLSLNCFIFIIFLSMDCFFICKTLLTFILLISLLAALFINKIELLSEKIDDTFVENKLTYEYLIENGGNNNDNNDLNLYTYKYKIRSELNELIQIVTNVRICGTLVQYQLSTIIHVLNLAIGLIIFVSISMPLSLIFWIHAFAAIVFGLNFVIFVKLIANVTDNIGKVSRKLRKSFCQSSLKNSQIWSSQEKFKFNYQLTACIYKNSFTVFESNVDNDYLKKVSNRICC